MDIRYPATAKERPRILLVEPRRNNLGIMARRLAERGFRVTTAEAAQAAIAELCRHPIDLVLAELTMSPTSGAELAGTMRNDVRWSDVPIILITGKSRPSDAVQAYAAGADDVIAKPFHFEVLFANIDRRLSRAWSVSGLRSDNAALDARLVERAIEIGELRDRLQDERMRGSLAL